MRVLLGCILIFLMSGSQALAQTGAKNKYLEADACYKKLRHSEEKKKKLLEWLNCIDRYEDIYLKYPDSSWAPAGMYKAAQLYLTLFDMSADSIYQTRAADLLARIQKRYPASAYSPRAEKLLKTFTKGPVTVPVKHLRSKKAQTRKRTISPENAEGRTADLARPNPLPDMEDSPDQGDPVDPDESSDQEESPQICASPQETEPDTPEGDTHVTDLRFWSNPEYTRVVINASSQRDYTHRLLKKDPSINQPFERLYVDIEHSRLAQEVPGHTLIDDNLLKQARAGQYLPHTVRVVVDIKSFENYKIFSLKDPFRIVIDVWGTGDGTPLPIDGGKQVAAAPKETPKQITTDHLKSSDITRQLALGVRKIVIDPGHGGSDPGAPGAIKGVWEKDIVLKLATTLAQELRDRMHCTVVLTRSTDKKLTLEERTAIANTQRADLFISLHCNAAQSKTLRGIETYILNLATDEQAIAVAARENATSKKNISDLEYILSDLMKNAKIEESTRLANDVHQALVTGTKKKYSDIKDLGVKQAPFYVLLGARMPSILIESSFISNKKECKRLLTASYRNVICNAIADGVEKYINATNPRQL